MKWGGQEMQLVGEGLRTLTLQSAFPQTLSRSKLLPRSIPPPQLAWRPGFLTSIITDLLLGLETSPPPCGLLTMSGYIEKEN